jgi:hypothetical protein
MEKEYKKPIQNLGLKQIQDIIEEIRRLDLEVADIDIIKEKLKPLFKGYTLRAPIYEPGLKLYRGRVCNKKPNNIEDVTYPPAKLITKYQRVNRPGQSVFYCCAGRRVPFFECFVKTGDKFILSQWKTVSRLFVNNIGYLNDNIMGLQPKSSDELKEANILIRNFIDEEFTKIVSEGKEYLYKISIALAEKHFSDDIFNGLLYPSIAIKGRSDNLALKPHYVDKNLMIERVDFIQIISVKGFEYKIKVLDLATSFGKDGSIEWKGHPGKWYLKKKGDELILAVENGRWVARDRDGRIVERN